MLLALIALAAAWAFAPADRRARTISADWDWATAVLRERARRGWRAWRSLEALVASRLPRRLPGAPIAELAPGRVRIYAIAEPPAR